MPKQTEGEITIRTLEDRHGSGTYPKRPLALSRGRGSTVWDVEGNAYLDMTSGQGVALLGHSHPQIVATMAQQAERLITCPEIFYNDRRAELYEQLTRILPDGLGRIFLCNSGAEAVEAALKLARLKTGRSAILAFQDAFHGRTLGALSATWNPKYREPFTPLVPEISHVPFNDPQALDQAIGEHTAAVLVEAVQGEGGVTPAADGFLPHLRKACDRVGALLILDEIQTGLGRTGRWFGFSRHGIAPDAICLGKGLAGGVPMGALVWRSELGELPGGSHGSTFGGNPLACAAAVASLRALQEGELPLRAGQLGERFLEQLRASDHRLLREVRGEGLMIGIDLRIRATPVLKALLTKGVLALPAGPTVVRLLPPLVVTEDELMRTRSALLETLDELDEG